MRKVFNSDFRRKVKEIMAAALSICLVFGTLTIPVKVRAAGSDDFLTESKLTADMVLLPYDILQFDQDGDSYNRKSMVRIERYVDSTTYTGLNHNSYGAVPIEVDGNAYWHGFTVPEAPAGWEVRPPDRRRPAADSPETADNDGDRGTSCSRKARISAADSSSWSRSRS